MKEGLLLKNIPVTTDDLFPVIEKPVEELMTAPEIKISLELNPGGTRVVQEFEPKS